MYFFKFSTLGQQSEVIQPDMKQHFSTKAQSNAIKLTYMYCNLSICLLFCFIIVTTIIIVIFIVILKLGNPLHTKYHIFLEWIKINPFYKNLKV